jgi:thioredoxin 1
MVSDPPGESQDNSPPEEPRDLDAETFEPFITGHELVLVDVWAEWCGPCKEMEPAIEELAAEMDDLAVGKVDHETHPDLLDDYRSLLGSVVQSLPAIFIFSAGECVERMTGRQSKASLESALEPYR